MGSTSTGTGTGTGIDFILEKWNLLMNTAALAEEKDHVETLYEGLRSLKTFLIDSEMIRLDHQRVQHMVNRIVDLAYDADNFYYLFMMLRPRIVEKIGDVVKEMEYTKGILEKMNKFLNYHEGQPPVFTTDMSSNKSSSNENLSTRLLKYQIQSFYAELGSLSPFLVHIKMINPEIAKDLEDQFKDLAYDANWFMEQISLGSILKELVSIKKAVTQIYENKLYGIGDPQVRMSSGAASSSRTGDPNVEDDIVVGFDHELDTIKERLASESKQLDVISIVGMAGLGKTTLAKKLYNDAFVLEHFYIRGWTYVSQVYRKRDLLFEILSCIVERKDEISTLTEEKLGEQFYKRLKGRRYLMVIDDIWNIGAWEDLRIYFPNDHNGSRILLTSRSIDVALKVKPGSPPYRLRFLSEDESWNLLQQKVFQKESCPPYLADIGRQIAQKCDGLPLAIVVIAGLLAKTDKTQDWWRQVARRVSSHIASDIAEQCMDTLALSYNHLPRHLKLCFLYIGAFPEDSEICVRKLIWLWIAEGFIHGIGQRTLEDVAEDYLMDLIDRSLVLVAKKRSTVESKRAVCMICYVICA